MLAAVGRNLKTSDPAENSKGLIAPANTHRVILSIIVGAGINLKSPTAIP